MVLIRRIRKEEASLNLHLNPITTTNAIIYRVEVRSKWDFNLPWTLVKHSDQSFRTLLDKYPDTGEKEFRIKRKLFLESKHGFVEDSNS